MKIVFALGISNPLSMMVVAIKTSALRVRNFTMFSSSSASFICPCTMAKAASGTSFFSLSATLWMSCTRLCTKYTCPSRFISLNIPCLTNSGSQRIIRVSMAWRSTGGVSRLLISFMPRRDRCRVLGMGVAVMVRISIFSRSLFSFSLCSTPNLCSSSMITNPRSLNFTSSLSSRCVPITISTLPVPSLAMISRCSEGVLNLLRHSTTKG